MSRTPAANRARILFVDDEPAILEVFERLWAQHYEVVTALGPMIALEQIEKYDIDVVVSDMKMPVMDGAALLARIRARKPDISRILLTGYTDLEAAVRAVNEGGIARFLTKPCPMKVMAEALGEAVAQRRARKQLVQTDRLATLGTMSAVMGHEMRNALAVMQGAIEEIAADAAQARPADPELVEMLVSGQQRLVAHAKTSLAFVRKSDQHEIETPVDDVISELAASLQRSGALKRVKLVLDLASDLTIMFDPTELEQIVINLVKNSVDAMAEPNRGCIAICTRTIGTRAYIEVSDNGAGIAAEHLARIFEPYFTTKPVGVGTGLGLPVVRQLIEKHGGSIHVTSEVGQGTTFRIDLPRVRADNVRIARASRAFQPRESR